MATTPSAQTTPSNVPIPDPSLITAQEIAKAKVELRDEFKQLIAALRDVLETRLHEIDIAKQLLAQDIERRYHTADVMIADLKAVQNINDQVVDQRAQAANDALERLLNSSINATTSISDVRHEATQLAITKVENQLTSAFTASKAAIDAALTTANSAVEAVDKKSLMRHEAAADQIASLEHKLSDRIVALKSLIDLGNDMSKEAITKAENANEKRFSGLNELRGAMSDQAASFLPRSEAEARFRGAADKQDQLSNLVATNQLDMKSMMRREDLKPIMEDITKLRDLASTSGGKNQVWGIVGGGALSIVAIIVALISVFHIPNGSQSSTVALADSPRRSDELITQTIEQNRLLNNRLDALTNRLTSPPKPTP